MATRMSSKGPKTANAGADEERGKWMRQVRTIRRQLTNGVRMTAEQVADKLIAYGEGRAPRNAKANGGLGRK